MSVTVNGGTSVKFNSTELQSANVIISGISAYGGLEKDMSIIKVARGNKSRTTNTGFPQRAIPCSGKITGSSLSNLKSNIDAFVALLDGVGNLDIDLDQAGAYRRWIAEPDQIDLTPTDSPLAVNFSFNFVCVDPWGRDTSTTTVLSGSTISSAATTVSITIGGTLQNQLPIITLTVTSFTGASSNSITIKNPATGQQIVITRTWTAGDVIVIDFAAGTVKVNGTKVYFSGPLANMGWKPGSGGVYVTDDFSARSLNLAMTNLNRYK